jgi:hypothetical protein
VFRARRSALAAALGLLMVAAAPAPARKVASVPFELNGNVILLQVRVNGSRPLWFVLDTGAYGSSVNSTVAQALGLRTGRAGVTHGAAGPVPNAELPDVTLDVNGALLEDLDIHAFPLAPFENNVGRSLDGILGSELFRRYVVEIDYDASVIHLWEPAGFDYRGPGEILPIDFHHHHPYVRAKVTLPGREPIEGEFVVDAGSNLPLILLPRFIEENKLRASLPPTLETYGRGVGGEVSLPIGRASRLQLGRFALDGPVAAFPRGGEFGRAGKTGNIGSAILRRFRVTFDYSRRRMILEPRSLFAEPFEFDMSGLQLVTETPRFQVVRVNRVLQKSPAEEAGIRQGDEILSFGGRPVTEFRLATLREMLRQPGKQYSLLVKRGGETVSVELRTRRLV